MKRTARVAVYEETNQPFSIVEYPLRPVRNDEVLVRVSMSTICRSDIHSYLGHRPNPCPGLLGHEIIGVIEQKGSLIEKDLRGEPLREGDRLTWTMYFHDGDSYHGNILDMPQKSAGIRKYGHDLVTDDPHFCGGFAEYCYILPGTGILKLPDILSDEEAAPLNCGASTMVAVTEAANIRLGDVVVVQGLGLLGLYGCALAKSRGARCVIGLDSVADRLKIATRFGADLVIDVTDLPDEQLVKRVREQAQPDGVDVVLEVCGYQGVIPAGLQMLRTGGCYVLGGLVSPGAEVMIDAHILVKKWITLRGIHNYHPRHLVQAVDFVVANRDRYPFASIVDSKFTLNQIDTAFARAADRTVLRAAIIP